MLDELFIFMMEGPDENKGFFHCMFMMPLRAICVLVALPFAIVFFLATCVLGIIFGPFYYIYLAVKYFKNRKCEIVENKEDK